MEYGHVSNLIANAVPSLSSWEEHSDYSGVGLEVFKIQHKVASLLDQLRRMWKS